LCKTKLKNKNNNNNNKKLVKVYQTLKFMVIWPF